MTAAADPVRRLETFLAKSTRDAAAEQLAARDLFWRVAWASASGTDSGSKDFKPESIVGALQVLGLSLADLQTTVRTLRELVEFQNKHDPADAAAELRAAREAYATAFEKSELLKKEAQELSTNALVRLEQARNRVQSCGEKAREIRKLKTELQRQGCPLQIAELPLDPELPLLMLRTTRSCVVDGIRREDGEVFRGRDTSVRGVEIVPVLAKALAPMLHAGVHYAAGAEIPNYTGDLSLVEVLDVPPAPTPEPSGQVYDSYVAFLNRHKQQETTTEATVVPVPEPTPEDSDIAWLEPEEAVQEPQP